MHPTNTSILQQMLRQAEAELNIALPEVDGLADAVAVSVLQDRQAAFWMGESCPRIFAVRSGTLKQSFVAVDGKEWVKSFAGPGQLFACPFALREGGLTSFASVSIGRSVVESIDYRLIDALGNRHLDWQKLIRSGLQRLSELKVSREQELLSLDANAMYRQLVHRQPEFVKRVPQKDLAAYLGVTAVGLNRIIKRARTGPADSYPD